MTSNASKHSFDLFICNCPLTSFLIFISIYIYSLASGRHRAQPHLHDSREYPEKSVESQMSCDLCSELIKCHFFCSILSAKVNHKARSIFFLKKCRNKFSFNDKGCRAIVYIEAGRKNKGQFLKIITTRIVVFYKR